MNVAEVIVDVSSKNIDRPFDYKIPDHLKGMIEVGMRVIVPFGPRKLQGFVTGLKDSSELNGGSMKEVEKLLDLTPVLTEELMLLSSWLSDKTLSFKITALQVMLPAALKAKYEKELKVVDEEALTPDIKQLFRNQKSLLYSDITDESILSSLQKFVRKGSIDVTYKVAQKNE
ncbi:hypothetical protein [Bacillus amyloliquefaciens]|uniref:primosomal protein N' family DNA-binding protein n=1 Tax=Bacillus amyloliquefaciens TaxID=1390 RepID=UPI000A95E511|nr:hypothetical protein [Bacillus amyloliquefaciens]